MRGVCVRSKRSGVLDLGESGEGLEVERRV